MPHAEKNLSHHVHDSFIEPCSKKSRSDYSSSRARRDTDLYEKHEAKSQKWSFSTGSADGRHQSNRCQSEGSGGSIDVKYDSESRTYRSGEGGAKERDCNKTNQHPFVLPRRQKVEHNSDVTFSGTSTSFIGPLYPPQQEKPVRKVTRNLNAAASSFRIATVEVGKLASQSKGQDGMDYELRQFYKELNELEAEADDQNEKAACTDVDVKRCLSPYPNKTPAPHPSNHHHGQVPTVQPVGPFPSAPTNLVSLACRAREGPRTPLPLHNPFSCDGQAPYHPKNSSFLSHAVPPPRFEGHPPPTFIVPFCPPPPQFNYPVTFPRQSNPLPPQPAQNFNYSTRGEPAPWHGSPAPPESRFNFQGIPSNKPFSQGERTWQNLPQNDLCRPQNGQFAERMLPPTGNVSHEQHPGRFRDERKMVLLRGVPGSGKSTLARTLLQRSPDGMVLSTDDYFCQENGYTYDVKLLGDAHSWNQNRARRALDDGRSPVIIDNTNIQGWEMKPYVQMAVDRGYEVQFLEPDTWWKQDAHELEKRNTHRVPHGKISQMLERYEYDMTVPVVMNSVEPPRTRPSRPPPDARPRWGASVDCAPNSSSFHSR